MPRRHVILSQLKDKPNTPEQLIPRLDQRLASLQTDHVDLILLHALGDCNFELELRWLTSPQLKQTADAIRKSGKARFVGFSTHHLHRALLLQAAATARFLDAIMLQNNPWIAQDDDMNRALDACSRRGIGLISMKQILRRPVQQGRRHGGGAGQPDQVSHLSRTSRLSLRGKAALLGTRRVGARLAWRRPRRRPPGLSQSARLRQAPPEGRGVARLTRHTLWYVSGAPGGRELVSRPVLLAWSASGPREKSRRIRWVMPLG